MDELRRCLLLVQQALKFSRENIDVWFLQDRAVISGDVDDLEGTGCDLAPIQIWSESVQQGAQFGAKQHNISRITFWCVRLKRVVVGFHAFAKLFRYGSCIDRTIELFDIGPTLDA